MNMIMTNTRQQTTDDRVGKHFLNRADSNTYMISSFGNYSIFISFSTLNIYIIVCDILDYAKQRQCFYLGLLRIIGSSHRVGWSS